jgi:hypothetical protein
MEKEPFSPIEPDSQPDSDAGVISTFLSAPFDLRSDSIGLSPRMRAYGALPRLTSHQAPSSGRARLSTGKFIVFKYTKQN